MENPNSDQISVQTGSASVTILFWPNDFHFSVLEFSPVGKRSKIASICRILWCITPFWWNKNVWSMLQAGLFSPRRMCIFTWTFLGDFNLETFSLQCVSPYYEITVQSQVDEVFWWPVVLSLICSSHNCVWWRSQLIFWELTMPGYPNAPPSCNGEVSLEHGSRGSLIAGKAKVGSGPFHRQTQCVSFPLEWTHNNSSRCLLTVFSMCFVISYLFLWRHLNVHVWENPHRIFSCVLDV